MLEIQRYLIERKLTPLSELLAQLEAEYGISAKQHSRCPNLWLFKYSQVCSEFSHKIVQECRGIVLDHENNWAVVSCPYFKFFNFLEPLAATIDWSTARVQEKLDGSLISIYCHHNKWHVATSGCPDGTNKIGDFNKTFDDLFWECFRWPCGMLNPTYTYMWELTSPLNRVVVDHHDSKITLIGIRNNITLEELSVSQFKDIFPTVVEYPLTNLEECISAANKLNPLEHEGFVVVDKQWHRIKIKSKDYLILHHLRDRCSVSRLAEVIRDGEYLEFSTVLDTYPEIKVRFLKMVKTYNHVVRWCNIQYAIEGHIKDQKEFAMRIANDPYKSVLFSMRKTGKLPEAIIKDMNKNAYLRLMGIKE